MNFISRHCIYLLYLISIALTVRTQKNKANEYLNKPLLYYSFLATIFSNSVATGQYAKISNEPLGFVGSTMGLMAMQKVRG